MTLLWPKMAVAAALVAAAQPAPQQMQVIPLDVSGPRPIAMLTIGSRAPVPVIFDTGASGNVLDIDFARESSLPNMGEASVHAPSGAPIPGFQTSLAEARLGEVPLADARAVALASPAGRHLGVKGVFGPGSFAGRLVHLDLGRGELRITEKTPTTIPAGVSYPYSGDPNRPGLPGLPAVPVEIAGQTFPAHVDTGQPGLLMFPTAMASQLPLESPMRLSERQARFADGVPRNLYDARIRGIVRVGPLTFENPEVKFMDGLNRVNVGVQALGSVTVVLDPEERRSWLVPAA